MGILVQVAQFILSLSILIVLHEMGHFIPAKLFKTRVEKFYLFFDPYFSLFKFKKGETEYGIGWLPLGGYVKISGMIDESMDTEQMKQPPKDWEFRAKPAWQRLIIMLGGVTVNVILGILIYAMVLFVWGERFLPNESVKYGIAVDSTAMQIGLKNGDKIVAINGQPVTNFNKVHAQALLNETPVIQVNRDGQLMSFTISQDMKSKMLASGERDFFVQPRIPASVDSVVKGDPAEQQGIRKGDKIISVNGQPTPFVNDIQSILQKHPYTLATVRVLRNERDTMQFTVPVTGEGTIGFQSRGSEDIFKYSTIHYSFLKSFPAGIHKAYDTFDDYIKQMKMIFTVKGASKQVGGFVTIGRAYSKTWNWPAFWAFTAFLSIVLAVMNILPIPALDGGHVMFLLYEVITRRKPNEKFLEYAQYAGMILLLALFLFANGNDVMRLFSK